MTTKQFNRVTGFIYLHAAMNVGLIFLWLGNWPAATACYVAAIAVKVTWPEDFERS